MEGELRRQLEEANVELGNLRTDVKSMEAMIGELRQREKEMEDELKTLRSFREEQTRSMLSMARPILVGCDRTLPKFAGRPVSEQDPEVEDWVDDVRMYIEGMEEAQKISTIMGLVTGEAEMEIRLCPSGERDTAEKIFGLLVQLFQAVDDVATLCNNFFSRLQQPQESLQSYSLALMKLRQKIVRRGHTWIDDKVMTVRFTEGARDPIIRRELRRLQKESGTEEETFSQFRKRVLKWMPEETQSRKSVSVGALYVKTLQNQYDKLVKLVDRVIQEQEQLMEKMKRGSLDVTPGNQIGREPSQVRCWNCGHLGHISRNCMDDRNKVERRKTMEETGTGRCFNSKGSEYDDDRQSDRGHYHRGPLRERRGSGDDSDGTGSVDEQYASSADGGDGSDRPGPRGALWRRRRYYGPSRDRDREGTTPGSYRGRGGSRPMCHRVDHNRQKAVPAESQTLPGFTPAVLAKYQEEDPVIGRFLELRKARDPPGPREVLDEPKLVRKMIRKWSEFTTVKGVLYLQVDDPLEGGLNQLVLPRRLRKTVLQSLHEQAGHPGKKRTLGLVRHRCYWPTIAIRPPIR